MIHKESIQRYSTPKLLETVMASWNVLGSFDIGILRFQFLMLALVVIIVGFEPQR